MKKRPQLPEGVHVVDCHSVSDDLTVGRVVGPQTPCGEARVEGHGPGTHRSYWTVICPHLKWSSDKRAEAVSAWVENHVWADNRAWSKTPEPPTPESIMTESPPFVPNAVLETVAPNVDPAPWTVPSDWAESTILPAIPVHLNGNGLHSTDDLTFVPAMPNYCSSCGLHLADLTTARFCPSCGMAVQKQPGLFCNT